MKLYTIGFTKKSSKQFFELLQDNNVRTVADIRLNNSSQLAGFTKGNDLRYFLKAICNADYLHLLSLAPTKELLDGYKKKAISWLEYEKRYQELLESRANEGVLDGLSRLNLDGMCLLCSEEAPERCHRRLSSTGDV
jgi:uncharacterized protein (DUF488 family)